MTVPTCCESVVRSVKRRSPGEYQRDEDVTTCQSTSGAAERNFSFTERRFRFHRRNGAVMMVGKLLCACVRARVRVSYGGESTACSLLLTIIAMLHISLSLD